MISTSKDDYGVMDIKRASSVDLGRHSYNDDISSTSSSEEGWMFKVTCMRFGEYEQSYISRYQSIDDNTTIAICVDGIAKFSQPCPQKPGHTDRGDIEDTMSLFNIDPLEHQPPASHIERPPHPQSERHHHERPGRKLSISASSLPVNLLGIPPSNSVPPVALSASAPSLPQTSSMLYLPRVFNKKNKGKSSPAHVQPSTSSVTSPVVATTTITEEDESAKKERKKWKLTGSKKNTTKSKPFVNTLENPIFLYLDQNKGNSFGGTSTLDSLAEEEEMPRGGRGRSNAFYMKVPPSTGPPFTIPMQELGSGNRPQTLAPWALPPLMERALGTSLLSKPVGILSKFKKTRVNRPGRVVKNHSSRFIVGYSETVGRRMTMEDEAVIYGTFRGRADEDYFAVFDGHGGRAVATYAADELHNILIEKLKHNSQNPVKCLKEAFSSTQLAIEAKRIRGGATAVVALFLGKKGYVANCGDSRAVLCRDGIAVRVSIDHKPSLPKEEERVRNAGGTVSTSVMANGTVVSRVQGTLAVSRALGDAELHPYVTWEPDIHGPINLETHVNNQFMIIACDGIWDVISDQEAVRQLSN
eukprot:gene18599-22253_t